MRTAQTILTVIQERGKRKLPLERVYKMLFNRELYLAAYAKLYSNSGAMTKGVTNETVDGMSIQKIDNIIAALRDERYQWKPVRREYIPKKNGKKRPLGLPTWSDKLLQEVIRMILEAYYEPQFSEHSHGFRPNRACHTALQEIQVWKGTKWFIEGDISKYLAQSHKKTEIYINTGTMSNSLTTLAVIEKQSPNERMSLSFNFTADDLNLKAHHAKYPFMCFDETPRCL